MMPMRMMPGVVAFQRDEQRAPLPPVPQMVNDARARIERFEERLARVEAAVTAVLEQGSTELLDALRELKADILADDPNGAVVPQLENLSQVVVKIGPICNGAQKAVAQSNEDLARKLSQHHELQGLLRQLQQTLASGDSSRVRGFLQECSYKGASYAAHH